MELKIKGGNSPGIVLTDKDKPCLTVHAKSRTDIFSGKGVDIIYEKKRLKLLLR